MSPPPPSPIHLPPPKTFKSAVTSYPSILVVHSFSIVTLHLHSQTPPILPPSAKAFAALSIQLSTVPGLFKIFDEILVNAADNKGRDPSMDSLKVTMDPEANAVSAYNNGNGVPVEIRQEEEDDEGEQAQRRRNTGNLVC
ncbi:hypothetical protein KIW84_035383 [Lathyrus oleraceus]|uniref:DNA topoisomerase (ATP-hydrolyzing) n=1 Tax=Pisum sativum TaxID=3888 RepID=A0A9D5B6L9_PEA|nr:hypothetical protein KIW84_035383 [Pisum sativum]